MAMESYFVSLLEMSGAEEILLLRDSASSACPRGKEKKKDMMLRRTVSLSSYGPPSRPLRKASSDNLHHVVKASNHSKKTSSKKHDALKDFFNEVAPGLRPRQKSRERSKTNSKNQISQQVKEGGASPADSLLFNSNSKYLLRKVFSDVVQSQDDHSARPSHDRHVTRVYLKEFLEEIEVVVGGRRISSNMGMSRKEARWRT
jgi:hypothetical protein